jgi:predicted phosphodiesterase
MFKKKTEKKLMSLLAKAECIRVEDDSRWVIWSDLHLGNGGKRDDFAPNGNLFYRVLVEHYYEKGFNVILNGDIEESQKFSLKKIVMRYRDIYKVLQKLHRRNKLFKLIGNHDYKLSKLKKQPFGLTVREALKLDFHHNTLFLFHGHQADHLSNKFRHLIDVFLRFVANPLGIKNYSVAFNNRKKFKLEQIFYDFAMRNKLLALIGHTHRPLFESRSKIDSLKMDIDRMCRLYAESGPKERKELEERIKDYKGELVKLQKRQKGKYEYASLYHLDPLVPCLFNSGCAIGPAGVTSLEIEDGEIRLVYWFDSQRSQKYFDMAADPPEQLPNSNFYRVVLKSEPLDYIFSRVRLLSE